MAGQTEVGTKTLETAAGTVSYYPLAELAGRTGVALDRMPFTVKILLENVLRLHAQGAADDQDVEELSSWQPIANQRGEFPFLPARVLMQDFTGVPAVVDLAAMRSAMARLGGDPQRVNPLA